MDFTDLLLQHQVEYKSEGHHHCRPGWVQVDCPYCGTTDKWHLGYNLAGGYFHCWVCGFHPTRECLEDILKIDGQTASHLNSILKSSLMQQAPMPKPRGRLRYPAGTGGLKRPHKRYLSRRGYNPQEIEELWHVRGTGAVSTLPWRLILPIENGGAPVSWTSRSISDNVNPRYRTASPGEESEDHRKLIYGIDYCLHSIIVHEGPLDAWRTGPGAVATLGLTPSQTQLRAISRFPLRIICFDSTPDAQHRAAEIADVLSAFPGDTIKVELETGKDAAEASYEEILSLRKMAAGY